MADFPHRVAASTANPDVSYERRIGLFATHSNETMISSMSPIFQLNEGKISVYRGVVPGDVDEVDRDRLSPVYALGATGPVVVPTGLILVRFAESVRADDRSEPLEQAGYGLVKTLGYAPEAGWVRALEGGIAGSLKNIARLGSLGDVVHVEPQMLGERARR